MADKAIYSVDTVTSMSGTDKVYVNTGNNIKQITKNNLCGNDAVKEINVPWFFGDDTTLTSTTKSLNHGLDISKITSVFGYCNECYSNQPLLNKSIPYYASGGSTGFDDYGIKYHLDETKIHIEVTRGTDYANNGWFRGGNVRFLLSHKL